MDLSPATMHSRRDVLTTLLPAVGMAALAGRALATAPGDATAMAPGDATAMAPGDAPAMGPAWPLAGAFRNGEYILPPLGYAYDALEPHIDRQTMELHHARHHQSYVDGLNRTLKAMSQARAASVGEGATPIGGPQITALQEDLAFHGSGHILHTVFWATMKSGGGGAPRGGIGEAIARDFGSFAAFQNHFTAASVSVKGSGWGILAVEPSAGRLIILQVRQHDLQTVFGCVPILPLDVWEHAYYLKHQNRRGDYVKAWWNVVDWDAVDGLYRSAVGQGR